MLSSICNAACRFDGFGCGDKLVCTGGWYWSGAHCGRVGSRLGVKEYDSTLYGFTVSSPEAGSAYAKGAGLNVIWTGPLMTSELVDVFLYNQDGIVETIKADTPNAGTLAWTPSASLAAGAGYYIRIISRTNDKITGESGAFELAE